MNVNDVIIPLVKHQLSIFFCWTERSVSGELQFSHPVRERDGNPFQKQARHPSVKLVPAAAGALFLDMISDGRIINSVELCHYIMEYGLTITTPG